MKDFLESAKLEFTYYKSLGDKTFAQLTDEELFYIPAEGCNSIAIIVKHMWGNMRSRWTNFLTEDGEKEWRNRDGEFEADIHSREELLQKWEEGWKCLFDALESIQPEDYGTIIYIRNMGHSITMAVNRQIAHYSYHVGQLVLLAKIIKGSDWNALSIGKGKSKEYNEKKFAAPRKNEHFSADYLDSNEDE